MKRTLSWLFGVLACFGPPVWAAFTIEADLKAQLAGHGWVCGNPMIGIMLLAGISSGFLSLIATGFSVASFRSLLRPQSKGCGGVGGFHSAADDFIRLTTAWSEWKPAD